MPKVRKDLKPRRSLLKKDVDLRISINACCDQCASKLPVEDTKNCYQASESYDETVMSLMQTNNDVRNGLACPNAVPGYFQGC